MRYAIVGAGISGLSVARMLLAEGNDVQVYETDNRPGGLVKCGRVNGHLFHITGGHVFNTKRTDVLNWFWGHFDRDAEFAKAERNSVVSMIDGRMVAYPIEYHAYQFSDEMMRRFIADLMGMIGCRMTTPQNFDEFLRSRFGDTLYTEYFKPYNEKIWRRSLKDVPLSWLDGKLPMPTVEDMLYHNFCHAEERSFVHSTFYYPRTGGSQFIADRLAQGLNIRYETRIERIERAAQDWRINGETYDRVVFCGNIKDLPDIVRGIDMSSVVSGIDALESHGTTTVLCEIDDNPYSWVYMPTPEHQAHRIICTGNFSPSNRTADRMSATIEFTGYVSEAEIHDSISRIPFSPRYLAHNYNEYTYPLQKSDTRGIVATVKSITEPHGLYLSGRFAEWEYYNMDAAMGSAIDLIQEKLH